MMVSNTETWIPIFDVSDVSQHSKGFTIYRIVSMLYPETCPEAITRITVWKRFNDFKKLHKEMKVLHKKFSIKDRYPNLPAAGFFKRFDKEVIEERRRTILNYLEYIGSHPQLFTSQEFVQFFESSHTPIDHLKGNIDYIRADLNLPEDPIDYNLNSDDDLTTSDTDSVTTLNSLMSVSQSKPGSNPSIQSHQSDSISPSDSILLLDGHYYTTPPNTPRSPNVESYIIDASIHIGIASEMEKERNYEDAFTAYKTAIDILLKYGKDDKNYDRKQVVKYKTEKYLIRAEKIYNMYLAPEVKNLRHIFDSTGDHVVQGPICDLYKFKVVKIIESGMLALHTELQQLFYIKVIHKTMKFLNDNLILPENVPYMVKLHGYYNCENALFLVLDYCRGMKLREYLQHRYEVGTQSDVDIFRQVEDMDNSDTDSDCSYTDLINEYNTNRKSNRLDDDDVQSPRKKLGNIVDNEYFPQFIVPIDIVVKWAAQLVLALEKLHILGVVCRDLQPHNILINDDNNLILTYMCNISEFSDIYNTKRFNLAPEIYCFRPITRTVDWWCFGVILYELLVGMPLSTVYPDGITGYTSLKIPKYVTNDGRMLLKQLLTCEPRDRLGCGPNGIENLKSHPFFHSINWSDLIRDG